MALAPWLPGLQSLSLPGLIAIGLLVGVMNGFWGMGGRFLMTPLLNAFLNIPYNVAIGSDICQMVGTSSMNMVRYKFLGTADVKLAFWMTLGAILGVESGVRSLETLKQAGDLVLFGHRWGILFLGFSAIYGVLLCGMGTVIYREGRRGGGIEAGGLPSFPMEMTARLQTVRFSPMISLPGSGVPALSLWLILAVGFLAGLVVGFLGVGGSFILLPALIYILGCPMGVARSTEILGTFLLMVYATFSHSLRGNIDLLLVIVLFLSVTVGLQAGIFLMRRFSGEGMRRLFAFIAYGTVLSLAVNILIKAGLVSF